MKEFKCLKCSHKWIGRTEKPLSCPNCKNRKWNVKSTTMKNNTLYREKDYAFLKKDVRRFKNGRK